MTDKKTSVKVMESTIKALREFEVHPRQTHEEIILTIIKEVKKNEGKKLVKKTD